MGRAGSSGSTSVGAIALLSATAVALGVCFRIRKTFHPSTRIRRTTNRLNMIRRDRQSSCAIRGKPPGVPRQRSSDIRGQVGEQVVHGAGQGGGTHFVPTSAKHDQEISVHGPAAPLPFGDVGHLGQAGRMNAVLHDWFRHTSDEVVTERDPAPVSGIAEQTVACSIVTTEASGILCTNKDACQPWPATPFKDLTQHGGGRLLRGSSVGDPELLSRVVDKGARRPGKADPLSTFTPERQSKTLNRFGLKYVVIREKKKELSPGSVQAGIEVSDHAMIRSLDKRTDARIGQRLEIGLGCVRRLVVQK